ncbi:hypothetical protein [Motiliproteus sp.]|uniref:hypothetical protein n=1 Tax=Motiliproteus sp. TaxID=1898955 RepID=UPI003BAD5CA2
MELLLWKLLVSILAVLGLSLVAERVSPKVAGVLSGYPLGSAIALFFIGLEQGQAFAAEAAVSTLAGFSASLVLAGGYYLASSRIASSRLASSSRFSVKPASNGRVWFDLPVAAVAGVLAFLLASALLQQLTLGLIGGALITLATILLSARLFKHIDNVAPLKTQRLSRWVMLLRALMAAATVLLITGLAELIGPTWSGLLSAFPITLFPFMLIMHYSYGPAVVYTVIRNYPMGLGALLCYTLTVALTYPDWGVPWGTALGFVVATLYLWGLYQVLRYRGEKN